MTEPTMHANVVALVNPKSGERASASFLFDELNRILPGRVVDLSECFTDQSKAIDMIEKHACRGTVIVAGGDGTVSWGMDLVDRCDWGALGADNRPHITVIPMGTGNDLSRALGMGPGFSKDKCCCTCSACCRVGSLDQTVDDCVNAKRGTMDRWTIEAIDTKGNELEKKTMNNYFSIGFDAHIAKKFDTFRRENPKKCSSRFLNKIWYAGFGARAMCGEPVLNESIKLQVDGADVPLPSGIKSLVISNVDSFAAGVKLWKDSDRKFKPISVDDGLLEVQGIFGTTHMGFMQVKLRSAAKIAQGSHIVIIVSKEHWMQWDGEAMDNVKEPCTLTISHHSSPMVLQKRD